MDKIYEQAKDLHVVATQVYANDDHYAYVDPEYTTKFKKSALKDAFIKGALIVNAGGDLVKPAGFIDEGGDFGIGHMTYFQNGSSGVEFRELMSDPDKELI